jgi:hypothetical protein
LRARESVLDIFKGLFTPIEVEDDIRENEKEELTPEDIKEIKANNWFKMIYWLTKGDITKTENLMKTNANYVFHTLGFEKSNSQWITQFK